jgi:hypothetical protein
LGSPSFVGLNKNGLVPAGLIAKLISQHRPTCIKYGLSHPGFCELRGADIADDDQLVFASYLGTRLVKMVLSSVRNLSVDGFDAPLITGALLNSERGFMLAIVLQGWDGVAIATRRKRLQSEINSDFTVAGRKIISNLALETNVPSATSVLSEASGLDGVGDIPRFPEMEFTLEVDDVSAFDLHGTVDKGQPSEGAFGAAAGAETRSMACGVTGYRELLAYLADRIGVKSEIGGASGGQLGKIEVGRPTALGRTGFVARLNLALDFATVVPDKIDRAGVSVEMLPDRRILDTVFECEDHQLGSLPAIYGRRIKGSSDVPTPGEPAIYVTLGLRGSSDTWKSNGFPPRRERRGFHPRSR